MKEEFSNIHFGTVGKPPIDWRAFDTGLGDANDESAPVEYDVAEVLGFDPDEENYSEDVINGWEEVERAPAGTAEGGQWISGYGSPLQEMQEYKKGVDIDTENAIKNYTQVEYHIINDQLRNPEMWEAGGGFARELEQAKLTANIELLDKFIKDAPKYKGDSYRGLQFANESELNNFLSKVSANGVLQDKGYSSTSVDHSFATNFIYGHDYVVLMKISGKKGVYLNGLSSEPREQEVLFGRGTKFLVKEIKDLKDSMVSQFGHRWKRYVEINVKQL